MKKLVTLFMAMIMAASLGACGGSLTPNAPAAAPSSTETPVSDPAAGAEAPAAPAEVVEFDLSTTGAPGTLLADTANYFASQVSELSGGAMKVNVFPSSALGSEAENLAALTAGTLDMAIIAIEFYSNSIPELGALILPYAYSDYDQVHKVLSGPAGAYGSERLRAGANVENLGYYVMMFRNMYMDRPINTVADLAGVKIRVPESTLYVNTMNMFGAAPTPMAFGEVYTACETGVISGYENTPDSCLNASMFEVLDYLNVTRHLNAPTSFSMSAKVFDGLTAEQQEILKKAGEATSLYGLGTTKAAEADFLAKLSEKMTVVETDVASLKAAIDYSNYDFMKSAEAQNLMKLVQEATAQ